MDPLFIVHFFFARKQIKQVCKLQVQTMQDLYKQEAMPILKLLFIQFYEKSSKKTSHGVCHSNPSSFINIIICAHLNLLCVYISHLNHIGGVSQRQRQKSISHLNIEPHWGCLTKTKTTTKKRQRQRKSISHLNHIGGV